MDNDFSAIKKAKKLYRKFIFTYSHARKNVLSYDNGNKMIYNAIIKNKPLMIARLGSTETHCLYPWMRGKSVHEKYLKRGHELSGIFPPNQEGNTAFSKIYGDSITQCDAIGLCGVYKEKYILKKFFRGNNYLHAKSIEPYYFDNPWSVALRGKKVLVIHPFVTSIRRQYSKRETLFTNKKVLPQFKKLEMIEAVQSSAGSLCQFPDWTTAYYDMCKRIENVDFDVAIIGAGAYALPLAAFVKRKGKIAIQLSGATQLLFGIKGKRWDEHTYISKLYNKNWVRPLESETPKKKELVEGGSYW